MRKHARKPPPHLIEQQRIVKRNKSQSRRRPYPFRICMCALRGERRASYFTSGVKRCLVVGKPRGERERKKEVKIGRKMRRVKSYYGVEAKARKASNVC